MNQQQYSTILGYLAKQLYLNANQPEAVKRAKVEFVDGGLSLRSDVGWETIGQFTYNQNLYILLCRESRSEFTISAIPNIGDVITEAKPLKVEDIRNISKSLGGDDWVGKVLTERMKKSVAACSESLDDLLNIIECTYAIGESNTDPFVFLDLNKAGVIGKINTFNDWLKTQSKELDKFRPATAVVTLMVGQFYLAKMVVGSGTEATPNIGTYLFSPGVETTISVAAGGLIDRSLVETRVIVSADDFMLKQDNVAYFNLESDVFTLDEFEVINKVKLNSPNTIAIPYTNLIPEQVQ